MPKALRTANLLIAACAITAPMAHVLELPNKLALDGPLWLAVQLHLYRGWGLVFGPVEIMALLTSISLAASRRSFPAAFRLTLLAAFAYAAMLADFFALNDPVNRAVNRWTTATLPGDWPDYRIRWETGHALAAALSIIALISLICALRHEERCLP